MLIAFVAAITATAPMRPAVAVVQPAPDARENSWLGTALADDLTNRLYVHSRIDAQTRQPIFPFSVLGWRAAARAAQDAGIDLSQPLRGREAQKLGHILGADLVFVGSYTLKTKAIALRWTLAGGGSQQRERKTRGNVDDVAAIAEAIFADLVAQLGGGQHKIAGHALMALPLASVKPFGEGLALMALQSRDPWARIVVGQEELGRAYLLFKAATDASPRFARGWVERGITSVMRDDPKTAESELVQAMKYDDEVNPATALGLYYLYDRTNKWENAVQVLQQSTETHLGFLLGVGCLGQALMRWSHPHEALTAFTTYQSRAPKDPWVRAMRTVALARIGKHALAIEEAVALHRAQQSAFTAALLASRYIDAKQLDAARSTLTDALAHNPSAAPLLTQMANLHMEAGDLDAAVQVASLATAHLPTTTQEPLLGYAHAALGHALALTGRANEAFTALRKAVVLGIDSYDRVVLLRDKRLKIFINDPRCPIQPIGQEGTASTVSSPP